jgi:hypothetical protein
VCWGGQLWSSPPTKLDVNMASSNLDDTDMRLGKPVIAAPRSGSKKN